MRKLYVVKGGHTHWNITIYADSQEAARCQVASALGVEPDPNWLVVPVEPHPSSLFSLVSSENT